MAEKVKKPDGIGSRLSGEFRRMYYRIRLNRICRVLDIVSYHWQKQFVLNDEAWMPLGRCTGKTMAVVLRILVRGSSSNVFPLYDLGMDPDAKKSIHMLDFTYMEYRKCYEKCNAAGLMRGVNPLPRPVRMVDIGVQSREYQ